MEIWRNSGERARRINTKQDVSQWTRGNNLRKKSNLNHTHFGIHHPLYIPKKTNNYLHQAIQLM